MCFMNTGNILAVIEVKLKFRKFLAFVYYKGNHFTLNRSAPVFQVSITGHFFEENMVAFSINKSVKSSPGSNGLIIRVNHFKLSSSLSNFLNSSILVSLVVK